MLQPHPVITIDVGNHYLFDVKWSKVSARVTVCEATCRKTKPGRYRMGHPRYIHYIDGCVGVGIDFVIVMLCDSIMQVRPMVFAVASADGSLHVYDLNVNIGSPVCKLKGGEVGVGPSEWCTMRGCVIGLLASFVVAPTVMMIHVVDMVLLVVAIGKFPLLLFVCFSQSFNSNESLNRRLFVCDCLFALLCRSVGQP